MVYCEGKLTENVKLIYKSNTDHSFYGFTRGKLVNHEP